MLDVFEMLTPASPPPLQENKSYCFLLKLSDAVSSSQIKHLFRNKGSNKKRLLNPDLGKACVAAMGLDGKESWRLPWARSMILLPVFFPNACLGVCLSWGAQLHCHQSDLFSQKQCVFVWAYRLDAFSFY